MTTIEIRGCKHATCTAPHRQTTQDSKQIIIQNNKLAHVSLSIEPCYKASQTIIASAKDLYTHANTSCLNKQVPSDHCIHFLCSSFYVDSTDIDRARNRSVKTLKGTRSLHAVRCVEVNTI